MLIFICAPGDIPALLKARKNTSSHENEPIYCLFIAHFRPLQEKSGHRERLIWTHQSRCGILHYLCFKGIIDFQVIVSKAFTLPDDDPYSNSSTLSCILSDERKCVLYPVLFYQNDSHIISFSCTTESRGGVYMKPLAFQTTTSSSPSSLMMLSLTPHDQSSLNVFPCIIPDIFNTSLHVNSGKGPNGIISKHSWTLVDSRRPILHLSHWLTFVLIMHFLHTPVEHFPGYKIKSVPTTPTQPQLIADNLNT